MSVIGQTIENQIRDEKLQQEVICLAILLSLKKTSTVRAILKDNVRKV